MYYINKIIGFLTSPLGLTFIGLGVALVLYWRGGRLALVGKCLAGVILAWLWIMSCGITTCIVGVGLESSWGRDGVMHGSIEGLPDAEAIVVLGGGVTSHEKCHAPDLGPGADRVWHGARLYNDKKSRVPGLKVYCTGGGCEYAAIPLLTELGVPREAIWFSEDPRNTEEEAQLIRAQFASEKPKILLVTSAWHMSRAKVLFDHAGFDVIAAPTDFEMSYAAEKPIEFGDFVPSADALYHNTCAIKEWVGRFGYWVLRK